jgi:hypothetical protein
MPGPLLEENREVLCGSDETRVVMYEVSLGSHHREARLYKRYLLEASSLPKLQLHLPLPRHTIFSQPVPQIAAQSIIAADKRNSQGTTALPTRKRPVPLALVTPRQACRVSLSCAP